MTGVQTCALPILFPILLLCCTSSALAGGISEVHFHLPDVFDGGGFAVRIEVGLVDGGKNTIEGVVLNFWSQPGAQEQLEVGEKYVFQIHESPRPDEPSEWYKDLRYWNKLTLQHTFANEKQVILIPIIQEGIEVLKDGQKQPPRLNDGLEIIADTPENVLKIAAFAKANFSQAYVETTPLERLKRDLLDPDMWKMAYEALSQRRMLVTTDIFEAILDGDKGILKFHLARLNETERRLFIEAFPGFYTKHRHNSTPALAVRLACVEYDKPCIELVVALEPLLDDGANQEDRALRDALVINLVGIVRKQSGGPAPHLVPLVANYAEFRSRRDFYFLKEFAGYLEGPQRIDYLARLLSMVQKTRFANDKGIDFALFEMVVGPVLDSPAADFLDPLGQIDLARVTDVHDRIVPPLVEMLLAIAESDPKSKSRAVEMARAIGTTHADHIDKKLRERLKSL